MTHLVTPALVLSWMLITLLAPGADGGRMSLAVLVHAVAPDSDSSLPLLSPAEKHANCVIEDF